ncbi:MAG TPA: A24 family peptidase [Streptosporangiaceae bacterium]|nr:A24 family peptidase [Streptosporangiaceae bacterium]
MDTAAWVTTAGAALAGLVAGRLVVAATAWVPAYAPPRRLPSVRCPHGAARLRAADLMPVTGWRRLRGRCAECAPALGSWCVAAELLTAGVFTALAVRLGPHPVLPAFCYLGAVGVALAVIDARVQRLPDALTLPSYPVALVLLGVAALAGPDGARHFLTALAGLAGAGLFFLLQALIYPAGIGWGDVKLSGLLGLYLGWLGAGALVAGLFAGYLLAAVAGLALLAARRASRKSLLPFGPFLLAGTLIAILLSGL